MANRRIAYGRILGTLLLLCLLFVLIGGGIGAWMIYTGRWKTNVPDPQRYPVFGVDVSRYQGNIDWETLEAQDVAFAFIKATEGSSYQDPCFAQNWENARFTAIYTGAYHFFSFESEGTTQAENFIQTVGALDGSLPPVVDLEFYGDYASDPLSKKETRRILDDLLAALEEYYGVKPIIYTTTKAYYQYLFGGNYGEYPLWMRNTYLEPFFVDWEFWQYSDQGYLEGYDGKQADQLEACIDFNVYHGSMEEFLREFALPAKEVAK